MKIPPAKPRQKYAFFSLFIWFLILFLLTPLVKGTYAHLLLNISFSFMLVSTVFTLKRAPAIRLWITLFVIPTIILHSYSSYAETYWPSVVSLTMEATFVALVSCFMFKEIFLVETVELDLIFEALCIYVLLAIFWALLYSLTELVIPGSFQGVQALYAMGEGSVNMSERFSLFLYFSFVTQTTLGYGDITPVHTIVRNLASLQAMMVPFYLTAVVAGLIGILLKKRHLTSGSQ